MAGFAFHFGLLAGSALLAAETVPLPEEYAALRLGEISFATSTNSTDAEAWFRYGLLHLLSFGYDYATPAFRQSRENDPSFALAYAFEALTYFWPLWATDLLDPANSVLANITDEAMASEHEKLYIEAVREHFNKSRADQKEARLGAAIAVFERIASEYPQDATALAFQALWRLELASTQVDTAASAATWSLAEGNLLAALAIDHRHPGAVHYQLHLYDVLNVTVAEKGLPAARLYPSVAPDASHGQHMPTHIYLRLANYTAVYDADFLALAAADHVCALYGLADDEGCDLWNLYHSLEYLQYAGYQCGRWAEAHAHWLRMNATFASASAKQHPQLSWLALWWVRMEAREILERGLLLLLAGQPFPAEIDCGVPPLLEPGFWQSHTESGALLAHGLCFVFQQRPGASASLPERVTLNAIRERLAEIPAEFGGDDEGNPSPYYNHRVNFMHVAMLDAADHFVQAQMAGDAADAQELLQVAWDQADNATVVEDALVAQPDSPTILFLSAHELLGILKLQTQQSSDAQAAFKAFESAASLQARQLSTELGRARARQVQGCPGDARLWYQRTAALLDMDHSDGDALPFWEAMQVGLQLEGECAEPSTSEPSVSGAVGTANLLLCALTTIAACAQWK